MENKFYSLILCFLGNKFNCVFPCIWYEFVVLNLMFPFELYDHDVICSVSVDILMENRIQVLASLSSDLSLRRSKINVPFHIDLRALISCSGVM